VGFLVPALGAGVLRLPRSVYLVPHVLVAGGLLVAYFRYARVEIGATLRRHWPWGLLGALVAGWFVCRNVLMQPASAAPEGGDLVLALLWLGIVYGTLDGLFLTVLPISVVRRAFLGFEWANRPPGRIMTGVLALVASMLLIAVYHLGYPEFRGPQVLLVVAGVGMQTLITLLAGNPLVAILAHVAMHVTAVLHGPVSVMQLPPHY
jgi:hypothetical protein